MDGIFSRIAAAHNCTVDEVKAEITNAIKAGLQNPDPEVRGKWAEMPRAGEIPTPEEVIAFCVREVIQS